MELFTNSNQKETLLPPLAERMRPQELAEFVGQEHLAAKNKILSKFFKTKHIFSMILWGPPGSGKTTLAKLISHHIEARFYQLNAVSSGVKDVRKIIAQGRIDRENNIPTILFIDEIHRFNKAQQDALLHAVEEGVIILIGATTENPSFEVIPPLLSRCRVLKLDYLSKENLNTILDRALQADPILQKKEIIISKEARQFLITNVNGDARKLLNALEIALGLTDADQEKITLDVRQFKEALQKRHLLYDKQADYHYDTISAFIKSIRGSDPDAALYWLSVMLAGGEDPLFIARRLIILASEDVGNANPAALMLANAGFQAVHSIGLPEGEILLAQVTTYLASSPKSNASYLGLRKAQKMFKEGTIPDVPLHLRNAPTKLMDSFKYGQGYRYPHDFEGHFVKENYFPKDISAHSFYQPTRLGRETRLKDYLKKCWPERYDSSSAKDKK